MDYGGASGVYTITDTDSGTTTINDDERVAWGKFLARQYWFLIVVREEDPTLNIWVEYLGGGGFEFTPYTLP